MHEVVTEPNDSLDRQACVRSSAMSAPKGGDPRARSKPSGTGRSEQASEMYKIAYDESKRTLEDQIDELNGIRTRAVAYLAFVGTGTAFLVGASLRTLNRDDTFYLLASIGTALLVLTLVAVILVLAPWPRWEYRLSGRILIRDWIEHEVPPANEVHLMRALTLRADEMRSHNEQLLGKIRLLYVLEIALGTLQLSLWVTLAWIVG